MSEKSFAIGTIAETVQSMGDAAAGFVVPLYPVVMATVKDDDEEVRSNAIYGLGVLAASGGEAVLPYPFCNNNLFLSVLTAIFPGEPGSAGFIGAKDNGSGRASYSSSCHHHFHHP